ncbi:class I SAM-dependent methyltransferase [Candidatus Pacearchaeota archaeon]|nr:class I SAM-dependent methyltransferase [Candidatus Pacearchaeota archaeon]
MNIEKFKHKYFDKKHWQNHPAKYSEDFSCFLKSKNFKGMVVDIGCGNGRDVNLFSKNGFRVLGIDNSEEEILFAKSNFPDLNFEVQNAETLNFPDNSIGAFFMINVIHFLNQKKALNEIFRALKPGGYFFVHFNLSVIDAKGNIYYRQNTKSVLNLVSKFKIISQKIFEREDSKPICHKHKILELILTK